MTIFLTSVPDYTVMAVNSFVICL